MGRVKPLVLKDRIFAKQGDAQAFFSEMLHRYIPGEEVSEPDAQWLAPLFERHPDYSAKSAGGILRFEVMAAEYGSQCFCVVRLDGTLDGFSYKSCIAQKIRQLP